MSFLIKYFQEKESKIVTALLFKESADKGDVENCWMLAACYRLEIVVYENSKLSGIYSSIAIE
jgi:hypothetical protein